VSSERLRWWVRRPVTRRTASTAGARMPVLGALGDGPRAASATAGAGAGAAIAAVVAGGGEPRVGGGASKGDDERGGAAVDGRTWA
jgi:hypothetical protein